MAVSRSDSRLIQIALRAQQIGAADIGRRVIGIGRDGAVEINSREIVAAALAIGQRAIGVGREIIGIEPDRLGEVVHRLLEMPKARIGRAAGVIGLGA